MEVCVCVFGETVRGVVFNGTGKVYISVCERAESGSSSTKLTCNRK